MCPRRIRVLLVATLLSPGVVCGDGPTEPEETLTETEARDLIGLMYRVGIFSYDEDPVVYSLGGSVS